MRRNKLQTVELRQLPRSCYKGRQRNEKVKELAVKAGSSIFKVEKNNIYMLESKILEMKEN